MESVILLILFFQVIGNSPSINKYNYKDTTIYKLEKVVNDSIGATLLPSNQIYHLNFLTKSNSLIGELRAADHNSIVLWSVQDGKDKELLGLGKGKYALRMAVSQDEERLVIISKIIAEEKYTITCFTINEKTCLWSNDLPKDNYFIVWFVKDQNCIYAIGRRHIYTIDSENGNIIKSEQSVVGDYYSNNIRMKSVSTSNSGSYFIIWNYPEERGDNLLSWLARKSNDLITVWDIVENKPLVVIKKSGWELNAAAFTQDEQYILLSCSDNKIRLFSLYEKRITKSVDCEHARYMISSEKVFILGKYRSATLLRYPDIETVENIDDIYPYSYNPTETKITVSKDGKYVAFLKDCKLNLYETEEWKELWSALYCSKSIE